MLLLLRPWPCDKTPSKCYNGKIWCDSILDFFSFFGRGAAGIMFGSHFVLLFVWVGGWPEVVNIITANVLSSIMKSRKTQHRNLYYKIEIRTLLSRRQARRCSSETIFSSLSDRIAHLEGDGSLKKDAINSLIVRHNYNPCPIFWRRQ